MAYSENKTSCETCSHNKVCGCKESFQFVSEKLLNEFNLLCNTKADLPNYLIQYMKPYCTQYEEKKTIR